MPAAPAFSPLSMAVSEPECKDPGLSSCGRILSGTQSSWVGAYFVSVAQLTRPGIDLFLRVASDVRRLVARDGGDRRLQGRVLGSIFYEPSTRTASSFQVAFQRLGGSCVHVNESTSSVQKGESLEDTVRTLACYSDLLVLRHPVTGSVARAASVCSKPIINAGDGTGEHPTQAMLDLLTIHSELGGISGKTIVLLGDLKHGRTVHSLVRVLCFFENVRLVYVSPPSLRMPEDVQDYVSSHGLSQREYFTLEDAVLSETDVLYVTRVQKERFANIDDYDAVKDAFIVTPKTLAKCKRDMIVMHPLPRVNEITPDVDSDPRAAYFREVECGMYARMAIMALLLGQADSK